MLLWSTLTLQQGSVADTVWKIPGPAATNTDYSGDLVALLGGDFQLEWFTDLTSYSVYLWQQTLDGDGGIMLANPIFSEPSYYSVPHVR